MPPIRFQFDILSDGSAQNVTVGGNTESKIQAHETNAEGKPPGHYEGTFNESGIVTLTKGPPGIVTGKKPRSYPRSSDCTVGEWQGVLVANGMVSVGVSVAALIVLIFFRVKFERRSSRPRNG